MKKVLTCVGTRPNFIKITQLEKYFKLYPDIKHLLLHTGQHFDASMSEIFFSQLNIRHPDIYLHINTGSQLNIIAEILMQVEKHLIDYKPDLVIVPGDVNSSFACAFAAKRLNIPVAHIESGLRSYDKSMPEEINRIIIDAIADLLFVTEQSGIDNLLKENKAPNQIHFVGNTMIDTLISFLPIIDSINKTSEIENPINLTPYSYATVTFHRPVNVDNIVNLKIIVDILLCIAKKIKVVFPVHPRTLTNLKKFNLFNKLESENNITLSEPLGYIDFLKLVKTTKLVITDSGGIQEETTFLKVPCLTVRNSTERPVTVNIGSNSMMPLNKDIIISNVDKILNNNYKTSQIPPLWDGNASEKIVKIIAEFLSAKKL